MSALSQDQFEKFSQQSREKLVSMKAELTEKAKTIGAELQHAHDRSLDVVDAAQVNIERSSLMAQLHHIQGSLKEVTFALDHFDDFGFCHSCGDDIAIERLKHRPESVECIECKHRKEHSSKNYI